MCKFRVFFSIYIFLSKEDRVLSQNKDKQHGGSTDLLSLSGIKYKTVYNKRDMPSKTFNIPQIKNYVLLNMIASRFVKINKDQYISKDIYLGVFHSALLDDVNSAGISNRIGLSSNIKDDKLSFTGKEECRSPAEHCL